MDTERTGLLERLGAEVKERLLKAIQKRGPQGRTVVNDDQISRDLLRPRGHKLFVQVCERDPMGHLRVDSVTVAGRSFVRRGRVSNDDAIERAYRKRVKRAHPDQGSSLEAFQLVRRAYRTLTEDRPTDRTATGPT